MASIGGHILTALRTVGRDPVAYQWVTLVHSVESDGSLSEHLLYPADGMTEDIAYEMLRRVVGDDE